MTSIAAYYQLIVASHAKHDEEAVRRSVTRQPRRSLAGRLRMLIRRTAAHT